MTFQDRHGRFLADKTPTVAATSPASTATALFYSTKFRQDRGLASHTSLGVPAFQQVISENIKQLQLGFYPIV